MQQLDFAIRKMPSWELVQRQSSSRRESESFPSPAVISPIPALLR